MAVNNSDKTDQNKTKEGMVGRSSHLCMVVHSYYPLGETRVEREALALIDKGIAVDVVCLRDEGDKVSETVKGVQIFRMPVKRHKEHGALVQLLEYLLFFFYSSIFITWRYFRRQYNVIQVHNLPDFLVFAALVPKLFGAKVILDIHDLMPDFFAEKFDKPMDNSFVQLVSLQEKFSCQFADHVITVTEFWRQSLIKQGIPEDKVSVVMNLADSRIFKPISSIDSAPLKGDKFRLIYHGSIPYRYGLDLVLEAIERLKGEIPEIFFSLIGQGEYLPELKKMAEEMNLIGSHVEFIPLVPADELPELISISDLGVVPYRDDVFTDALLPTKLLEYALMGLPTVASRTSTIKYYFDETMVEFFTPGDSQDLAQAIFRLYSDPNHLSSLGQGIQQFNQKFNWSDASNQYVELINMLS